MKLVNKHIERDGSGYVTLRPEDDEDMWHVYNLIAEGDEVRAGAVRLVDLLQLVESTSTSQDPRNSTATLQINGQVTNENDYVKLGAYHTLDLEANRDFRLYKASGWDSVSLERIEEATKEGRGADVGAVVLGEVIRQRIDTSVPRKRAGAASAHEKAMEKFFAAVYAAILRHLPFQTLRAIVIASPGFTKESLYDYIFQQASLTSNKALMQSRSKWVKVHSNTSHVHGLVEALRSPEVATLLQGTKFAREGIMLDK
ncbi:hypothetical protein QFC21_001906 [Naganishia friedmannii]|uniref:Uncharacterized protein n=1 Tax=Naganishia friedmannii TaxID=89922 RepID=A0ACC2W1B8_9TREE|nr:hypothetical protein QFC21_001906 [Naganishia friedmannii]